MPPRSSSFSPVPHLPFTHSFRQTPWKAHCMPGTALALGPPMHRAFPLPLPQASLLSPTLLLFFSSAIDLLWLMPCLFPAAVQGEHLGQRCGQTGISTCAALGETPESGSLSAARRRALGGVSTQGKQNPTD